jgi:nitrogen fixation NifU-like protein
MNQEKAVIRLSEGKKSEFDEFVAQLQNQIDEEARKVFSEKVINEYTHPHNLGKMENPSASAIIKGWCGDTMQLDLKIEKNKISNVTFFTDGCGATVACGSMITKLIQDKSINEIVNITEEDLKEALDGLPPENEHCAELTIKTLKAALENYQKKN